MTDNEIIKALECCGDEEELHWCTQCPYYDKENDFCQEDLHRDALNLINRQKAEISHYKNNRDKYADSCMYLSKQCDKLQEENQQLKAEIERLQKDSERLKKVQMQLDDAMKMYSTIKSQAVKEFAEKSEKELFIKQDEHRKHWEGHLLQHRTTKSYSEFEQAVDNWLRGYGEAVQDILSVNNNLVKEMVGDTDDSR